MRKFRVKNLSGGCVGVWLLFIIYALVAWVVNLVKLLNCDFNFAVSVKHEVIHAVGLIPGVSMITCWL